MSHQGVGSQAIAKCSGTVPGLTYIACSQVKCHSCLLVHEQAVVIEGSVHNELQIHG
jgi:hypothetical protein